MIEEARRQFLDWRAKAARLRRTETATLVAGTLAPSVVITGASRGIGRSLADRFAAAGHTVVLVARSSDDLDAARTELAGAHGVAVHAVACDVTLPDAPQRIAEVLAGLNLYCDVLVNNAGVGLAGPFADCDPSKLEALITLNITAVSRLMRAVLPEMVARGRGGILNIASLGGYVPGPNQAAYYASKAYVASLSEAVASEVAWSGVRVCVVAPGPADTRFHADMGSERAAYRAVLPALSPDQVAASAYLGYRLGLRVIVPGLVNKLLYVCLKVLPHRVSVALVGALLKLRV